jgi:hypothetical protein
MGVLYTKCDCGEVYENRRYADGIFCIRCWAKGAAREAMESTPQSWAAYDELTRSECDGEGLEGFQLEVLDVVRATLPRQETRHLRFKGGYNELRNDER